MLLKQVCTGQVNPYSQGLHILVINNERYIIYASGSNIVVHTDQNILSQIISTQKHDIQSKNNYAITAITSHPQTGQLVVAFQSFVEFFEFNSETKKWVSDSVVDIGYKITYLDWNIDGRLLIAGEKISLWKKNNLQWNHYWIMQPPTEILLAKFSPDGTMFATAGHFDHLVTIWYQVKGLDDSIPCNYEFIYLSHPRDVTHFTWRKLPTNSNVPSDCTLFTMCRDGVGRFWSPTDIKMPYRLYMCAVIDPSQSLVTSDSSASICSSHHNSIEDENNNNNHDYHEDGFSPIHYIGCDELQNALNVYQLHQSVSKHSESISQQIEKVKEMAKDTPDLLFRIQLDGSIIFWGIQYLNSWPRRIPRSFVVLRIDQVISSTDVPFFLHHIEISHDYAHIQSLSTVKPTELSLFTRNNHGEIRCYELNLLDFLDSTPFQSQLRLKYSWLGHQQTIKSIYQSQHNQFCTIGNDGQISMWDYGLREKSGKLTTQLSLDNTTYLQNKKIIVPIVENQLVITYDEKSIKILKLVNQDQLIQHHQQYEYECPMYDPLIKITSLYTNTISDDEKSTRHLLFGISTTQRKIITWEISYKKGDNNNSNTDCLISYRGCQDMDWEKEPDLLVSNNQWFESTVSKLLYRFQVKYGKVALLAVAMDKSILFYGIKQYTLKGDDDIDNTNSIDYSITVPENIEWEEIYKLDTGLLNPLFISFVNNIIAVVTKPEDKYNLSIWMEMRSSATPSLTKSFEFSEPIIGISWSVTSDSQFILAVAFQHKVSIFGQKRATLLEDDNIWILYSDIEMDTEDDVNGVTWLDNGVLIVTAGNQVRCYLKWITNQDPVNESINETDQCKNVSSLYELSYVANGPLPIYHPRHLLHYLLWGKFSLINAILQSLYKSLRQVYIVDDEQGNDIIQFVPTLSLDKIIELQNIDEKNINQQQQYQALFDDNQDDMLTIDEDDVSKQLSREEADQLIKYLKTRRLPRLSENEINQLLAMVDTFAEISSQGESLDENGARFTVLLEHHFHLNKILPPEQRKQQLDSRDIAYALHSQSQDLLLDRCIRLCDGKLLWEDARALGIFIWLQKSDVVNEQMLAIARNTYLAKEIKDPVDCTLFYLALRKKALLQNLWRSCSFHKEQRVMVKFLANDFSQSRWQTAAAKNAFVLLGRQRFEYAASFFLLADRLKDAINVILKNLKDYHLAIAICRVYDGDSSPLLKEIINDYVIPLAIETNDRWLLTTALWFNSKIHDAIRSIVVPLSQIKINENINKNELQVNKQQQQQEEENDSVATVNDPTLFILYQHVKQLHHRQELGISYDLEYNFSLQVTRAYERLGCPLLSLYILLQYPMKRPIKASLPLSSNIDTVENGEQQESRAADLFADDKPTPTIENDIFADMSTTKPSRAIDLFADYDNNDNSKSSTTADIFADVNTKSSYATNLFDDDDDNEKDIFNNIKVNTSTNIFDTDFGDNSEMDNDSNIYSDTLETEDDNDLRSYKAQLIIRMVQTIFNSASILYHSPPDPTAVAKYRNQYIENRKTLIELGEKQGISKLYIYKLLIEKCVELDVFPLYFDILDNHNVLDNFNIPQFLFDFQLGCFEIFDSSLIPGSSLDFATISFFEHWISDVISTFPVWSQLIKTHLLNIDNTNKIFKIALSAYICLVLITTKQRHYERSWTLLYHFPAFINHIFEEDPTETIISIFKEIMKNEAKMVEMDTDNFDSFSDDSVFGFDLNEEQYKPLHDFNDESIGAIVLEAASLNLILSTIEQGMYYNRNKTVNSEQLVEFIWNYLLDPIAYRLHHLQSQIDKELDHKLTKSSVLRHFKTLREKKYWRSLKSIIPVNQLLPFVQFSPPEVNVIPDESYHPHTNTVYNAGTTIHAFCINMKSGMNGKLGDILAVCTKSEIQEIDMSKTQRYAAPLIRSGSTSSKDHNHEHCDSYPDTEEEMDIMASDAETNDGVSAIGDLHLHQPTPQRHHNHHSHHHSKSPAGGLRRGIHHQPSTSSNKSSVSSTPVHRNHADDKNNNLNIENLQETLKRSLGVVKEGSDISRSSTGTNSVGSVAENSEPMITLRRQMTGTCAETHPEYPFYITGCEVLNDGPSVTLWQFNQEREITHYYGCHGKVTKIHFDRFGQKFGAGDTTGQLCLWKFDSHAQSNKPYYTATCHSKATRDFTFLNSSSLIATAGTSVAMSRKRDHLCIWDTLLPPSSSMVCCKSFIDNKYNNKHKIKDKWINLQIASFFCVNPPFFSPTWPR
ncbi:unnamed protein product [Cunninghamella echinulata]